MAIERKVLKQVLNEFQSGDLSNPKGLYQSPYVFPTINIFNTTNHTIPMGSKAYICGITGGGDTLSIVQQWMSGTITFDITDEDVTDYTKPDTLEGGLILARDGYYKTDSDRAAYCIVAEEIYPGGTGKASIDSLYATFVTCWEQEIDECMPTNCYTNKPLYMEHYNEDSRWGIYCGESDSDDIKIYPRVEGCLEWYESGDNTKFARFCLNGDYVVAMSDLDDYSMSGDLESPTVYEENLMASERKIAFVVYREKEHVITKDDSLVHIEDANPNPFGNHPSPEPSSTTSECKCVPYLTSTDEATLETFVYKTLAINSNGQSYVLPYYFAYNRFLPVATWNIDGSVAEGFDEDVIAVAFQYEEGTDDINIYQYTSDTEPSDRYGTFRLDLKWIAQQEIPNDKLVYENGELFYMYGDKIKGRYDYTEWYNKALVRWHPNAQPMSFDMDKKELEITDVKLFPVEPVYKRIEAKSLADTDYLIGGRLDIALCHFANGIVSYTVNTRAYDLRRFDLVSVEFEPVQHRILIKPDSTLLDYIYGYHRDGPDGVFEYYKNDRTVDGVDNPVEITIEDVEDTPSYYLPAEAIDSQDEGRLSPFTRRQGEYLRTLVPISDVSAWYKFRYSKEDALDDSSSESGSSAELSGYMYFPYALSLESGVDPKVEILVFDHLKDGSTMEALFYLVDKALVHSTTLLRKLPIGLSGANAWKLGTGVTFYGDGEFVLSPVPNIYDGTVVRVPQVLADSYEVRDHISVMGVEMSRIAGNSEASADLDGLSWGDFRWRKTCGDDCACECHSANNGDGYFYPLDDGSGYFATRSNGQLPVCDCFECVPTPILAALVASPTNQSAGQIWIWKFWPYRPRRGPQGVIGPAGSTGSTGATGATGPKGEKGDKGDTGEQGPQGIQGIKGEQGEQGPPGPKGDKGFTGETGPAGPQGIQGEKGEKGDPGDTGATGATGPKGEKGDKGDAGPAGATGQNGTNGSDGQQGPQGPQGIQGQQGPQGAKGDKGDPGQDAEVGNPVDVLQDVADDSPTLDKFLQSDTDVTIIPSPEITLSDPVAEETRPVVLTNVVLSPSSKSYVVSVKLDTAGESEDGFQVVTDVSCVDNEIVCTYAKLKLTITTATPSLTKTTKAMTITGTTLTIPAVDAMTDIQFDTVSVLTPPAAGG